MSEVNWYVVHTYSGYENKVKANIEKTIENRHLEDQILEVRVPMEEVVEVKNGTKKQVLRKLFPGYVLINMIMNDDTWYVVRNTRGVTGFVGPGSKPVPLTDEEMVNLGITGGEEKVELDLEVGDAVVVTGGAWKDTTGLIQSINDTKQMVTINVELFGRETPVLLVGCLAIVILAGCVAKFGVIDQYRRLDAAQAAYASVHTEYTQMQELLKGYDRLLMEYRTYSMEWATDGSEDNGTLVDRQKALDLLEQEMLSRGRLVSLQVSGNKMVVAMSGMSLDQISRMFDVIQQSPIVSNVELNLASTEDGNVSTILDFTVRITIRSAEEADK